MRDPIVRWIEHGEPTPKLAGSFLRALLTNNLFEAFAFADEENADAMRSWVMFLYNFAPSQCYGSAEKINAWHERGGLTGRGA